MSELEWGRSNPFEGTRLALGGPRSLTLQKPTHSHPRLSGSQFLSTSRERRRSSRCLLQSLLCAGGPQLTSLILRRQRSSQWRRLQSLLSTGGPQLMSLVL
ncbi:unnamed protein product [Pleuronectes platessa]|uniref:Uncharacterized protein n=1 Tax=Pleuronectes platessa TaxID=8262 RepID=A0A9N7USQ9_PLEPL|nr:unnamed protein product [Pleuronectes platessa]